MGHIHHEMGLHIDYCNDFGVTKEDIEKTEESQGMFDELRRIKVDSTDSLHRVHQVLTSPESRLDTLLMK